MVSGQVAPPQLDLANEDLVRAHVHAVWLAETGQSLGRSLTDLLDVGEAPTDPRCSSRRSGRSSDSEHARRRRKRAHAPCSRRIGADLADAPWW